MAFVITPSDFLRRGDTGFLISFLISCLDGHLMSTCLNTWYNMVIQVVKSFDTDGLEMQKISAICL